jgi:hypothetical protein
MEHSVEELRRGGLCGVDRRISGDNPRLVILQNVQMHVRPGILHVQSAIVNDESKVSDGVAPRWINRNVPVRAVAVRSGLVQFSRAPASLVFGGRVPRPHRPSGEIPVRAVVVNPD